jgi:hypothetical protein
LAFTTRAAEFFGRKTNVTMKTRQPELPFCRWQKTAAGIEPARRRVPVIKQEPRPRARVSP